MPAKGELTHPEHRITNLLEPEKANSFVRPEVRPEMQVYTRPVVLRDGRGRVIWRLPVNSPEENEALGIRNVQGLFIEKFPEFLALFPFGEDGKIVEEREKKVKDFVVEKMRQSKNDFGKYLSSVVSNPNASYFNRLIIVLTVKVFSPWGIEFTEDELTPRSSNRLNWEINYLDNGVSIDRRGRILWARLATENPSLLQQIIEDRIRQFVQEGNHFDQENLKAAGMSGWGMAIGKYYPGGSTGLRRKLNLSLEKEQKEQDYWQPEVTRREVIFFAEEHGGFSEPLLRKHGRFDILNGVRKYPGRMRQLRIDTNLHTDRKPDKYWQDLGNIEREALEFLRREGSLSSHILRRKAVKLSAAIYTYYPGGIAALRERIKSLQENTAVFVSADQAWDELDKFFEEGEGE